MLSDLAISTDDMDCGPVLTDWRWLVPEDAKWQRYSDERFGIDWADIALQNNLRPNQDKCLGWKALPLLGGLFSIENMKVYPQVVYQSINGQLFRQLAKV